MYIRITALTDVKFQTFAVVHCIKITRRLLTNPYSYFLPHLFSFHVSNSYTIQYFISQP